MSGGRQRSGLFFQRRAYPLTYSNLNFSFNTNDYYYLSVSFYSDATTKIGKGNLSVTLHFT